MGLCLTDPSPFVALDSASLISLGDVPMFADQQVTETVERFAERTKPISSGLPKAKNCFA